MGEIAEHIASENYEFLIHTVLGQDYTQKDRSDVLKYIKRKNVHSKISTETLNKLRVSCGDLTDVTRFYTFGIDNADIQTISKARSEYRTLLEFCPVEMIYEKAHDLFYKDLIFVDELCSISFNAGHHPGIANFATIQKIFGDIAIFDNDAIKSNIVEYSILCMVYNFSDEAEQFNVMAQKLPEIKDCYMELCARVFDRRRHYISQNHSIALNLLCAYQGFSVFSDEFKEIVYTKACNIPKNKKCLDIVAKILQTGFKKITAGFNSAVGYWDEEMVKVILPYKPKLDKALSTQTSPTIMNLLVQAAEQKKKKNKVN